MTAVRLVIIQMGLTHAPVTVATQEMDEPAMVNKLLDQMHRFHKKIFRKSRYTNFGTLIYLFIYFFLRFRVIHTKGHNTKKRSILKSVQL